MVDNKLSGEIDLKPIDLRPLINKAYEAIISEIENSPIKHVATYEMIEDFIFDSFTYDAKNNCIWTLDTDDVVKFALELTIIDEAQYTDYYVWKIFKVK